MACRPTCVRTFTVIEVRSIYIYMCTNMCIYTNSCECANISCCCLGQSHPKTNMTSTCPNTKHNRMRVDPKILHGQRKHPKSFTLCAKEDPCSIPFWKYIYACTCPLCKRTHMCICVTKGSHTHTHTHGCKILSLG